MKIVNKKRVLVYALSFITVIGGALSQYFYPGEMYTPLDIPLGIISIILVFQWYCYDSDELSYHRMPFLNLGVVALCIIVLPYYFFRTRGLKKGFNYTAIFLIFIVALMALDSGGAWFAYYLFQN